MPTGGGRAGSRANRDDNWRNPAPSEEDKSGPVSGPAAWSNHWVPTSPGMEGREGEESREGRRRRAGGGGGGGEEEEEGRGERWRRGGKDPFPVQVEGKED